MSSFEPEAAAILQQFAIEEARARDAGVQLEFEGTKSAALTSIAISLKRIADALTYQESAPENLFDHLRATRYAAEEAVNRRG